MNDTQDDQDRLAGHPPANPPSGWIITVRDSNGEHEILVDTESASDSGQAQFAAGAHAGKHFTGTGLTLVRVTPVFPDGPQPS